MQYKKAPRNRSKKQRTNTDNSTFIGIFLAVGIFCAIGAVGHADYQYAKLQDASAKCQALQLTTSFDTCINNELEK